MELDLKIEKLSDNHREAILDNREAIEALIKRSYQSISTKRACNPPNYQENCELWGGMSALSDLLKAIEGISQKKIAKLTLENTVE